MLRMKHAVVLSFVTLVALRAMAFERQPNADYRARREHLAGKLDDGTALLFAATEAEGQNALHGFRQDDDFYYLTGLREPGAARSSAASRTARSSSSRRTTSRRRSGPDRSSAPEDSNAPAVTGVDRVETLDKLRDILVEILPSPMATVARGRSQLRPDAVAPPRERLSELHDLQRRALADRRAARGEGRRRDRADPQGDRRQRRIAPRRDAHREAGDERERARRDDAVRVSAARLRAAGVLADRRLRLQLDACSTTRRTRT